RSSVDQFLQSQSERYECAGDRGSAGTAIGLNHVAVDPNGALAELFQIGYSTQRTADEALNLVSASAGAAFAYLARGASQRGARHTHRWALPRRNEGTDSSTDAVQITRVLPTSISTEPSAVLM